VDVQVHDRLARGGSNIEADVVTVWVSFGVNEAPHLVDKLEDSQLFVLSGLEPGGDQALGDDEGVAGADREGIRQREGEVVGSKPVGCRALEKRRALRHEAIVSHTRLRGKALTAERIGVGSGIVRSR
jgi:hypothetical protein